MCDGVGRIDASTWHITYIAWNCEWIDKARVIIAADGMVYAVLAT